MQIASVGLRAKMSLTTDIGAHGTFSLLTGASIAIGDLDGTFCKKGGNGPAKEVCKSSLRGGSDRKVSLHGGELRVGDEGAMAVEMVNCPSFSALVELSADRSRE